MNIRPYNNECDHDAVERIWRECGWITNDNSKRGFEVSFAANPGWVAELNGTPECFVGSSAGDVQHGEKRLPFSGITAVTTSHLGRRRGLATRATAHVIAESVAGGAAVSGLGMFDQGFYDRLGYGSGPYVHLTPVDPADLLIPHDINVGVPKRLTRDDWEALHAGRLRRRRSHGSLSLHDPSKTHGDVYESENPFGFGFTDASGAMTHHLWMANPDGGEDGPYLVKWMAYNTREQLLELIGFARNLGDQVKLVRFPEIAGLPIQLQDLVRGPFRRRQISIGSTFSTNTRFVAWWQMRICDLNACINATHLAGPPVSFNLELADPIEQLLDAGHAWRGCAGTYRVTFGPDSTIEPGTDAALPTLRCANGPFTRLWLGVRSATALHVTQEMAAPPELLTALDAAFAALPVPHSDWDF